MSRVDTRPTIGLQIGNDLIQAPSPRFADLLLVTGPVTYAMREPLRRAYEAMPLPRWVMAVGTCAVSGGVAGGGYACGNGLEEVMPVDLYLPGCPPNPAAMIDALLMFLDRAPQRIKGGRSLGSSHFPFFVAAFSLSKWTEKRPPALAMICTEVVGPPR